MRRYRAAAAICVMVVGLFAATPSRVSACISDHPTLVEVVRGARAIARVTVIEGFDPYTVDPAISETYRVERVLKGTLPEFVTLAPAWTSLCHDSVGYFAGAEESDGTTIVLAIDLPYYDDTIHPMWAVDESQGVWGTAGVPSGITTLAELEAAILAEVAMPDTATGEAKPAGDATLALVLVAATLTFAATVLRIGNRTGRSGDTRGR